MRSTAQVLDHHLKCFADRDLDGVLTDYLAGAVLLAPKEHCAGRLQSSLYLKNIRRVCETRCIRRPKAISRRGVRVHRLDIGHNRHSYEFASDTFVIQDGSIRLQAFTAKVKPKY